MPHTGRHQLDVYSPLPQSISDSDSDKELQMDSLYNTYANNHQHQHHNGVHRVRSNDYYSPSKFDVGSYRVDNNVDRSSTGFDRMSPLRKLAFVASILVCLLTMIVFVWVLPCDEGNICAVRIAHWDRAHENVEMYGAINAVRNALDRKWNVIMLFKNDIRPSAATGRSAHGVVSLTGDNGVALWWWYDDVDEATKGDDSTTYLNCRDLDVNADGTDDCLLASGNALKAIDSTTGETLWTSRMSMHVIADRIAIVADLNGDATDEIAIVGNGDEAIILSGRDGRRLIAFTYDRCESIDESVSCVDGDLIVSCRGHSYKIERERLVERLANETTRIVAQPLANAKGARNDDGLTLNGRTLSISNEGDWPDCTVNVTLVDVAPKGRTLLNWSQNGTYAMTPKPFAFVADEANVRLLNGHLNGFVVKFWQWLGGGDNRRDDSNDAMNAISEKVVLITFNATDFRIINVSANDVRQFCMLDRKMMRCQPSLSDQMDSLLIVDMNDDDSLELIDHSSTYEFRTATNRWHLVSNIKLIRLEAELPQLYQGR